MMKSIDIYRISLTIFYYCIVHFCTVLCSTVFCQLVTINGLLLLLLLKNGRTAVTAVLLWLGVLVALRCSRRHTTFYRFFSYKWDCAYNARIVIDILLKNRINWPQWRWKFLWEFWCQWETRTISNFCPLLFLGRFLHFPLQSLNQILNFSTHGKLSQ